MRIICTASNLWVVFCGIAAKIALAEADHVKDAASLLQKQITIEQQDRLKELKAQTAGKDMSENIQVRSETQERKHVELKHEVGHTVKIPGCLRSLDEGCANSSRKIDDANQEWVSIPQSLINESKLQEILAELKFTRARVASLEILLATSNESRANDEHPQVVRVEDEQSKQSPSRLWLSTHFQRLISLCWCLVVLIACAVRSVIHYERLREEFDGPWFHNSLCALKVLSASTLTWMVFGVYCFTEVTLFTDAGRHLSPAEAMYLNSQIFTTVGYGDHKPTTELGIIFMTFYSITAVFLCAVTVQHMITCYTQMSVNEDHVDDYSATQSLISIIVWWLVGAFFFACCPGEEKPISESMYVSAMAFLKCGFELPHTEFGQFIGAIWIFVGLAFTIKAGVDFTIFYHSLRSQAAAMQAFDYIDKTHRGYIDKVQFLAFELVREGIHQIRIDDILTKFDKFNLELNGTLNFEEFKSYVDGIERS